MIPLPVTFSYDQFDFEQIAREGKVALFRKVKVYPKAVGRKKDFRFETYEVVIVQKMGDHKWPDGRVSPAHEYMPGGELWGEKGWSLQTLERAWEKFREVLHGVPA